MKYMLLIYGTDAAWDAAGREACYAESAELARTLPAGTDYFGFALVCFAFFDYLTFSVSAFDNSIMEAQQNGTLEAMLVTETPLTIFPLIPLSLRN